MVVAAALVVAAGCGGRAGPEPGAPAPSGGEVATRPRERPGPLPGTLDPAARRWVDSTLAALTLREAAAQLVIQWIPGSYLPSSGPRYEELRGWVEGEGIGGLYLSIGTPMAYAAQVNELQRLARVPLLFASDFEDGGPGMRLSHTWALPSLLPQGGGTDFPPTMAFGAAGDEELARAYGRITGEEARAVGVALDFAPVLDVNSNPDNPVIGTRSFGGDPGLVARLGTAFIGGSRSAGLLATAKHFPGHGDTGVDSHLALPAVTADRARLDTLELVPFRRAVAAGVDAVMTAHVALPGLLGPGAPPATLSPEVLTGLLREEMGFDGLIVTDALGMAAVADRWGAPEAGVLALEAGADVLLSPGDVAGTVEAVVGAVRDGRLTEDRVRRSVRRVLEAKARAGLHRERFVDLEAVSGIVGSAAHLALADTAAARSLVLVRDRRNDVPLGRGVRRVLSLTFAGERDLPAGRAFDAELDSGLARRAGGDSAAVRVMAFRRSPSDPPEAWAAPDQALGEADAVVVGLYRSPGQGAGLDALPSTLRSFVHRAAAYRPTVLVALGSPWTSEAFPQAPAFLAAWGGHEVSQRAAARALLGEAAITGRLPVEVPPYPLGHGLQREAGAAAGAAVATAPPAPLPPLAGPARTSTGFVVADAVETDPVEVGMDPDSLERLDRVILEAIADSATPGAALAVGRHGRLVRLRGYGHLDWEGDAPVTPTTLYDLASVTKVVGTTTAVMMLEEEGRLDLDAPVVRYLPWWSGGQPDKERVTVRQLLLHRAGLPPFRRWFLEMAGPEAYRKAIAAEPLESPPGTETVYSDIGVMTLGFLVEAVSGERLDVFLEERVWRPLGMDDTGFLPPPSLLDRIAPTEVDTLWRGVHVHGVVHDENADALGGVAGHAGLFSTAWDLSIFAGMMLGGGALPPCVPRVGSGVPCTRVRADTVRLLRPQTVARYTRRWDAASSRGLGWDTPSGRSSAGDWFTARAFGHTGFTGTSIWIDPELDLFVVLLTNRVDPTRENQRHIPLRRAVHDLAATAITDRPVRRREGGGAPDPGGPGTGESR